MGVSGGVDGAVVEGTAVDDEGACWVEVSEKLASAGSKPPTAVTDVIATMTPTLSQRATCEKRPLFILLFPPRNPSEENFLTIYV